MIVGNIYISRILIASLFPAASSSIFGGHKLKQYSSTSNLNRLPGRSIREDGIRKDMSLMALNFIIRVAKVRAVGVRALVGAFFVVSSHGLESLMLDARLIVDFHVGELLKITVVLHVHHDRDLKNNLTKIAFNPRLPTVVNYSSVSMCGQVCTFYVTSGKGNNWY